MLLIPCFLVGNTPLDPQRPSLRNPPDQGQGGGQAIEDAGALSILLQDLPASTSQTQLTERLQLYQDVRIQRASAMQLLSNAGQEQAERIQREAQAYIDGPVPSMTYPSPIHIHKATNFRAFSLSACTAKRWLTGSIGFPTMIGNQAEFHQFNYSHDVVKVSMDRLNLETGKAPYLAQRVEVV